MKINPLRLYLKSPASLPDEKNALPLPAGSPANEMFVNLCTDDKTFFLRQVSSSNSTLMIRPRIGRKTASDADIMEEDDKGTEAGCSIIASCKGQLEVMNTPGWYDGKPFLTRALKVWDIPSDGDVRMNDSYLDDDDVRSHIHSVRKLFDDIPVSLKECIRDWIAVCGFVQLDESDAGAEFLNCYRPSAFARLAVWRKVIEASILADIYLCEEFLVPDLWTAILDGEGGTAPFPRPVFEAVVKCCCSPELTTVEELCREMKWGCLDKATTIPWTGLALLEASAPRLISAIDIDLFIMKWKDLLPEKWRSDATLDKIKVRDYQYICAYVRAR